VLPFTKSIPPAAKRPASQTGFNPRFQGVVYGSDLDGRMDPVRQFKAQRVRSKPRLPMTHYRIFTFDKNEHVSKPPEVFEFSGDQVAIDRANLLLGRQAIEVWDGARRVIRLPPKDEKAGEAIAESTVRETAEQLVSE
jgi:hypothetical protein